MTECEKLLKEISKACDAYKDCLNETETDLRMCIATKVMER